MSLLLKFCSLGHLPISPHPKCTTICRCILTCRNSQRTRKLFRLQYRVRAEPESARNFFFSRSSRIDRTPCKIVFSSFHVRFRQQPRNISRVRRHSARLYNHIFVCVLLCALAFNAISPKCTLICSSRVPTYWARCRDRVLHAFYSCTYAADTSFGAVVLSHDNVTVVWGDVRKPFAPDIPLPCRSTAISFGRIFKKKILIFSNAFNFSSRGRFDVCI